MRKKFLINKKKKNVQTHLYNDRKEQITTNISRMQQSNKNNNV